MKDKAYQSPKWKYIFAEMVGITAGGFVVSCFLNEYVVAAAMGVVVIVQILNYREWKKNRI